MPKSNELKTKQTGRHVEAKYYCHIKYFLSVKIGYMFTPNNGDNIIFG